MRSEYIGKLVLSSIFVIQKEVVTSGVQLGVAISVKHTSFIILILQMNLFGKLEEL